MHMNKTESERAKRERDQKRDAAIAHLKAMTRCADTRGKRENLFSALIRAASYNEPDELRAYLRCGFTAIDGADQRVAAVREIINDLPDEARYRLFADLLHELRQRGAVLEGLVDELRREVTP